MKKPKGFFTYFHHAEVLEALTDEEAGRVYKALMRYGQNGELPDFEDNKTCQIAFTLFRVEVDVNFERYRGICEKRVKAAQQRWGGADASRDD